jgi:hypothetical protein
MSSPDKPDTPESEKAAQELHARLGEHGSTLLNAAAPEYMENATRDRTASLRRSSSADAAVAAAKRGGFRGNSIAQAVQAAGGTVASSRSTSRAGNDGIASEAAMAAAGGAGAAASGQTLAQQMGVRGSMQSAQSLYEMNQDFAQANQMVNTAGAIAGYAMGGSGSTGGSNYNTDLDTMGSWQTNNPNYNKYGGFGY